MASSRVERRGLPGRGARRSRRPVVEALEDRRLLAAPFSVGGDDKARDLFGLYDDTLDKLVDYVISLGGAR